MKEIWKDIPEYEELYQISNLGRVRSKDRLIKVNCQNNSHVKRRNKNVTVKYRR